MDKRHLRSQVTRRTILAIGIASLFAIFTPSAEASFNFTGVAAGDASSNTVTLWTRAVDDAAPATATVTMQLATDTGFSHIVATSDGDTSASTDYTVKFAGTGLQPSTVYYYRFQSGGVTSIVGKFKTAPAPNTAAPLHFAFSGDNDGLMRPYALASIIPAQNLDFYINLGDVIYETSSNVSGNNGAPYLNSPSVKLSNDSLSFNGIPRPCPGVCSVTTTFATQAQLFADYSRKYRENFLPVNTGGQNSLQVLYAAQGNYTTWDNHELATANISMAAPRRAARSAGPSETTCPPAAASMRGTTGLAIRGTSMTSTPRRRMIS
jgi:phosphodiesterase/alkaline phosphatase D-like protein